MRFWGFEVLRFQASSFRVLGRLLFEIIDLNKKTCFLLKSMHLINRFSYPSLFAEHSYFMCIPNAQSLPVGSMCTISSSKCANIHRASRSLANPGFVGGQFFHVFPCSFFNVFLISFGMFFGAKIVKKQ